MSANPNRALLDRFTTAVFAGDNAAILSLCHADMVLEEGSGVSFAGRYGGGEGFLRFFALFVETFEIENLELLRIYETDDPDYLISEADLKAVVKATGKRFDTTLLERWQFKDGQVLNIKPHYFNAM